MPCWNRHEAGIAWSEVVLLVVEWVMRYVHLPVGPAQLSTFVDDDRGVVTDTRSASLEDRGDDDNAELCRRLRQRVCRRSGNGLCEIEERGVLSLAEVSRQEELGQTDDMSPSSCRVVQTFCRS